ncbi:MAG: hypothetical protein LBI05_10410 [Planctomycetaceae bacterium]|jgi:hypothetical protein|nr:hypothetical protein [Planctomycetaceae bacterium]
MSAILCFCSLVLFDAESVKILLDCDETVWQRLGDDSISPEQDSATFADLADKLARWVPRSLLEENATDVLLPTRGSVVRLEGHVLSLKKYDSVYRCTMELNNGTAADVFVSSVPKDWQHDVPIRERVAALGVYVKSYNNVLVFAAPAIQWFPDTWLGNLGFDVGAFDQVPVRRVTEREQNDEETNLRAFRFTESDREPFYGLLRAMSVTPEGVLEEEAAKQSLSVTDLFNRPQETRGRCILLHGTAKRIVLTPVADKEVQALFGIDHYYQIYLFTEQSQGNPIVVCVCSLPEGMSVGDAADFSESITVAAVPYKLWIYETPLGPHYAPILVGRSPVWHPQPPAKRHAPESVTAFSFTLFLVLVLIWVACRFWSRRSKVLQGR